MAIQRIFPRIQLRHAKLGDVFGECLASNERWHIVRLSEPVTHGERTFPKGWRIICELEHCTKVTITPIPVKPLPKSKIK